MKNFLYIVVTIFFFLPLGAEGATILKTPNNLGLVGYWAFNEGSGTTAQDFSGNDNHGTLENNPSWANGRFGKALSFNGSNQYVSAGDSTTFAFSSSNSFTLAGWVNPASADEDGYIISKNSNVSSHGYGLWWNGSTDSVAFAIGNSAGPNLSNAVFTEWSEWVHVAVVFSAGNVTFYKNGIPAGTLSGRSFTTPTVTTRIGNRSGASLGANTYMNGQIDEARIYNRALSAGEIQNLFTQGVARVAQSSVGTNTPVSNGLVGHWTFDGSAINWSTGQTQDSSGQGNTGSLVAMSTTTSPVLGKIGQALNFDGVDDYASVPSVDLSTTNAASVSWWANVSNFNNDDDLWFEMTTNTNSFTNGFFANPDSGGGCIGQITIILEGNNGYNYACYTRPSTSQWHHYVAIYNKGLPTNEVDLYIDGQLQTPTARPENANNTNSFGTRPFYIGSRAGTTLFKDGLMDDVRLYNRALSVAEVAQLYQMGGGGARVGQSQSSVVGSGLIGHWTFDGSKTNWSTGQTGDSSGQGNTGALVSMNTTTSPVMGKIGQALNFNGSNTYISMGNNLNITGSKSVAAWIRTSVSQSASMPIAGKGYLNNSTGYGLYVAGTAASTFPERAVFQVRQGSTLVAAGSDEPINDGKWHHIVGVRDHAANKTLLYVDGQLVDEEEGVLTAHTSSDHFGIGRRAQSATFTTQAGTVGTFNGDIDDVRVYNRALSGAEIEQLYRFSR